MPLVISPVATAPDVDPSVVFTFDPDTLYWVPSLVAVVLADLQ